MINEKENRNSKSRRKKNNLENILLQQMKCFRKIEDDIKFIKKRNYNKLLVHNRIENIEKKLEKKNERNFLENFKSEILEVFLKRKSIQNLIK